MKYKDGVVLLMRKATGGGAIDIIPSGEVLHAMGVADQLSIEVSGQEAVVTSVLDGVHSKDSLHYTGNAFDLRVWIYNETQIGKMVGQLKQKLGKNYDVVFEGDHIHVEYDPE